MSEWLVSMWATSNGLPAFGTLTRVYPDSTPLACILYSRPQGPWLGPSLLPLWPGRIQMMQNQGRRGGN